MRRLVLISSVALAACGAAVFDGGRFAKPAAAYRVGELDRAWQRLDVEHGDLAFHRAGHGIISVNATCEDYEDVPPAVLANHLLFGTTRRTYLVEEDVTLDGRGAHHMVVECELDGVPVRLDVYLVARNGCVFDLGYISSPAAPARAEFTAFVEAFRIERAGHE